jgi:transcriptional regulator with XRE-family HTH domain
LLLAVAYWRAMAHNDTVLLMASPDMAVLGRQVRERRLRLGLTQAQAADACSVSLRTFARIERGHGPALRDMTLASLDRGLLWADGSAQRVLDGGAPEVLPNPSRRAAGEDPVEWVMRQSWSMEKKLRVLETIQDIDADEEDGRGRRAQ